MKLSDEDMEILCDMLKGVYAHEEHCIYHDGIIYLEDIVKCGDFIKEHSIKEKGTMTDEEKVKLVAEAAHNRQQLHT